MATIINVLWIISILFGTLHSLHVVDILIPTVINFIRSTQFLDELNGNCDTR